MQVILQKNLKFTIIFAIIEIIIAKLAKRWSFVIVLLKEIMMGLFGNENKTQVKKLKKIADQVMALEEKYKAYSDEELKACTQDFKNRYASGESLNDMLPEAYAVMREASDRVLKMRHFYVQVLGGIALHQGRIAEMATGEGKTLVSTLPAYLNAISGQGVHVVTVNEYLAKRDAEWMGKVHRWLGLTVGVVVSQMDPKKKKEAYECDITYCTNNELGFDYLRDNMAVVKEQRVQRPLNFAIVDEVDSILIDEARTPLIISGRGMKSSSDYVKAQKFARTLKAEDYEVEPKTKQVNLTESGVAKAERYYATTNLSDIDNLELNHYINNALKANFIMFENENYIVKDGEVIIVDEFTGRLMPGRRYNDGLHQAIEAKEGVEIKDENKTLATITFQNYFRIYKKLSGMTGTAKTEEDEFRVTYKLDVVTIPTNRPNIRMDEPDIVFTTENGKIRAIIDEIKRRHEVGQPILVGTITIEKSEIISKALKEAGIKHTVLNAKNHEQESQIVAQAGRKGAVTIATNMAGRGTDILLGGNPEFMAKKKMRDENFTEEQISYATAFNTVEDAEMNKARERYNELYVEFKKVTDAEKEEVKKVGGLHIVGTERHESRRIDNQLRGRASRQGDPGSSVFFLSLDDDLLKRFGGERLKKVAMFFRLEEDTPIQLKILSRQIESAQKKIELQNFGGRKTTLLFDDVMNAQREVIYKERNKVLEGLDVHEQIMGMLPDVISKFCDKCVDDEKPYFDWDFDKINQELERGLLEKDKNIITEDFCEGFDRADLEEAVLKLVEKRYNERMVEAGKFGIEFENIERFVLLKVVDSNWMNHIDDMQIMKMEIFSRQFGNQDPIVAYKKEGYAMFDEMIERIRETTCLVLLNTSVELKRNPQAPQPKMQEAKVVDTQKPQATEPQKTVKNDAPKVGRNDLCPCGSGKKYKNCCGK